MATTPKKSGVPLDWAAGHGPVTGALSATTGSYAVAAIGAATHMPPAWALTAATAGAIGHTAAGLRQKLAGRTLGARAASWLLAGGWTTWATATTPLSWAAIGSLATLGVGMAAAARATGLYEEARENVAAQEAAAQIARELSAERRSIAIEWADRIQRVCGVTLHVLAVEMWPTGTGFSIDAELPTGGTTYDRIAREAQRLAADARLPHGCTATASPGIDQGRVIIDVTTVNVLAEDLPYPDDYGPLSIHTGLPWGVRTDGRTVNVFLREQCALAAGPTGSGKTNWVHTVITSMARATDILPWVIDLNAGSAGLPWVRPALTGTEGQAVRPGIDWLASTPEEAHLMLNAAIAIAKRRKVAYQQLMADANTDLLPVSPNLPQIMLIVDEGAEILASTDREMRRLAEKILEVIRISRAMALRTVLTALGATGAVLGNLMIRREAKVRVALTGGEKEGMDLAKLFPGTPGLRVEQAPYKGAGFLGTPESPPGLFKAWRIKPAQIRDIVLATSDRHPRLDEISAKAAGPDYARRWDQARIAWITETDGTEDVLTAPAGPSAGGSTGGLALSALRDTAPAPATEGSEEDRLAAEFRRQIDAAFPTAPDAEAELPSAPRQGGGGLNLSAFAGEQDTAARTAALTVLQAAGPAGTGASAIARALAAEFGTTRQTISGWLQEWAEDGTAIRVGTGTKTRYVHHTHTPEP
ncbi:cell division FtsK/SpoIIIE [Actinobacteria bacterium OV450]|nr:cell division FtsK/SpoIIIE [Actinobacteria bacterium OV450]